MFAHNNNKDMERKTFVLTQTREFRRSVRIFLKDKEGKTEDRRIKFTTEHKVSEKERNLNARKVAAEFNTSDERLYDGILRDTGYGETFVLKGDPEGKLKREPFDITPLDAKKIALKNLFEAAGLEYDSKKPSEVLEEEYQIFMNAKAGTNIKNDKPLNVDHTPVDLKKGRLQQIENAKKAYEKKYGEPIPEKFANDTGFLSALTADPNFDAKAYMAKDSDPKEETIEELREKYVKKFGANVANAKKNDKAWIKNKLAEE
jgi:hypothetical protein